MDVREGNQPGSSCVNTNQQDLDKIKTDISSLTSVVAQLSDLVKSVTSNETTSTVSNEVMAEDDGCQQDELAAPSELSQSDIGSIFGDGNSEAPDREEFMDYLDAQVSEGDATGPALHPRFASILDKRLTHKLPDSQLKLKMDMNNRPENCSEVATSAPKVNTEIWRNLLPQSRANDLNVADSQQIICKAATAIVSVASDLFRIWEEMDGNDKAPSGSPQAARKSAGLHVSLFKGSIEKCMDAVGMLGHAKMKLSHHRRNLIKPHLKRQYTSLCSDKVAITASLFGDDLGASVREVKSASFMAHDLASVNTSVSKNFQSGRGGNRNNYHPYKAAASHRNRGRNYHHHNAARRGRGHHH